VENGRVSWITSVEASGVYKGLNPMIIQPPSHTQIKNRV